MKFTLAILFSLLVTQTASARSFVCEYIAAPVTTIGAASRTVDFSTVDALESGWKTYAVLSPELDETPYMLVQAQTAEDPLDPTAEREFMVLAKLNAEGTPTSYIMINDAATGGDAAIVEVIDVESAMYVQVRCSSAAAEAPAAEAVQE